MVNVKEQQIFEIIIPEKKLTSKECPYVFYPTNIHGCSHPSNRIACSYEECSPKVCPFNKK